MTSSFHFTTKEKQRWKKLFKLIGYGGNSAIVLQFSISYMLRGLNGPLRAEIALSIFNFRWSLSSTSARKTNQYQIPWSLLQGTFRWIQGKKMSRYKRRWNIQVLAPSPQQFGYLLPHQKFKPLCGWYSIMAWVMFICIDYYIFFSMPTQCYNNRILIRLTFGIVSTCTWAKSLYFYHIKIELYNMYL